MVTNTGDTPLVTATLDDADLGITQDDLTTVSGDLANLAPGASATLYLDGTITGDLPNTADVSATPADDQGDPLPGVDDVTDSDDAQVYEVAPSVTIAKTVYRGHDSGAGCEGSNLVSGENGDPVTYCFVVTNDGDTRLTPVSFADADLGIDASALSGDVSALDSMGPGATVTLYYETTVDGDLTNTATVTGSPADGNGVPLPGVDDVTDADTAAVDGVGPAVMIAKTVYGGHDGGAGCEGGELLTAADGDDATWCFVVTNNGDTDLADVTVVDDDLTITEADLSGDTAALASMAPGDSVTLFYEGVVDGDVTNTAVATGTPVDGQGTPLGVGDVTDSDTAAVDAIAPAVSVAKTVYRGHDSGAGCPGSGVEQVRGLNGDAVTWCFVVANDGDTPLAPVTVDDADLGITGGDLTVVGGGDLASLDPGDSVTLYLEGAIDGDLPNTVTVTGTPVDGNGDPLPDVADVTGEDTAEVVEVAPAVSVAKTVYRGHDGGAGCAGGESVAGVDGDPVTYCFEVANTGDTALTPVALDDPTLGITDGAMQVASGSLSSLGIGESAVLYFETTLTGDVTNTVTATGTPSDGQGDPLAGIDEVTDTDTAQVDEVAPAVSVSKTVYRGHDNGPAATAPTGRRSGR